MKIYKKNAPKINNGFPDLIILQYFENKTNLAQYNDLYLLTSHIA